MDRHDAITTALAKVDKGQHGLRHHRWVRTTEAVQIGELWTPVYEVEWCFDCGAGRSEAEQWATPSDLYDDHPALGFCGAPAIEPGPWWENDVAHQIE